MAALTNVICDLENEKIFKWTVCTLQSGLELGKINPEEKENVTSDRAECLEVGEFLDGLRVVVEQKPLAMTIHNTSTWRRTRIKQPSLISIRNNAEEIAFKYGLRCIHNKETKGYNCFYYRESDPNGFTNALKLMAIVTNHPKISEFTNTEYSYCIGKLLGYLPENIKHFLLTRHEFEMTDEFVCEIEKKLNDLEFEHNDFNTKKVVILKKPMQIALETRKYNKQK